MSSNDTRSQTEGEQQKAIQAVLRRATWDAEFREKCLDDPRAAIREETGYEVPEDQVIRFQEPENDDAQ